MSSAYAYVGHGAFAPVVRRAFEEAGAEQAESLPQADIVVTYCTSLGELEDAYFDEDGIVKSARSGALLIDLSASTPTLAREMSAIAQVNDLRAVEAPMAVVDPASAEALGDPCNLVCYIAGEPDDVSAALPFVSLIADEVRDAGPSGNGQLSKAMHTAQVAAEVLAAVEGWALKKATRSLSQPSGAADLPVLHASESIGAVYGSVQQEAYEGPYTVELMLADVAAAMAAADDVDLILPQLEAAQHLLELLSVIGGSDMAPAALALVYGDEEASAAAGLDWRRAENLFSAPAHEHAEDDLYEDGLRGPESRFGSGFTSYSSN